MMATILKHIHSPFVKADELLLIRNITSPSNNKTTRNIFEPRILAILAPLVGLICIKKKFNSFNLSLDTYIRLVIITRVWLIFFMTTLKVIRM